MGWFDFVGQGANSIGENRKLRAHSVRDERGQLIGKLSPQTLSYMLDNTPCQDYTHDKERNVYVVMVDNGWTIGHPDLCKLVLWKRTTISTVADTVM